jgi:hypothetical protein
LQKKVLRSNYSSSQKTLACKSKAIYYGSWLKGFIKDVFIDINRAGLIQWDLDRKCKCDLRWGLGGRNRSAHGGNEYPTSNNQLKK